MSATDTDRAADATRSPFVTDLCVQLITLQPSRLVDLLEQLIETLSLKVAQIVTLPDVLLGSRNDASTVLSDADNDDYDNSVADMNVHVAGNKSDPDSVGDGNVESKQQRDFTANDKDAVTSAVVLLAALHDVKSICDFIQFVQRSVESQSQPSSASTASASAQLQPAEVGEQWGSEILADLDAEIGGGNWPADYGGSQRNMASRGYAAAASSAAASQPQQQCTYAISARDFLQQHWYYCYDCGLIHDKGCCSACVRVCHAGHDVTYAKFGPFFCDCGAIQKSCKALSNSGSSRKRGASSLQPPPPGNAFRSGSVSPTTMMSGCSSRTSATADAMRLLRDRAGEDTMPAPRRNNSNPNDTDAASVAVGTSASALPPHRDDWQLLTDIIRSQSATIIRLLTASNFIDVLSQSIEAVTNHIALHGDDTSVMLRNVQEHLHLIKRLSRNVNRMETRLLKSDENETLSVTVATDADQNAVGQEQQQQPATMSGEEIMHITIQAPEGAFKHARNPFMGEAGSNLRQLITHGMINRSGLCAMGEGAQKHLAIVSEKSVVHIMDASQIFSRFNSLPLLQRAALSSRPASRRAAVTAAATTADDDGDAATTDDNNANADATTAASSTAVNSAEAASGFGAAGQQKVINIAIFSSITLQFPVLSLCGNPQVDRVVIVSGMRQASLILFGPKPTHEPVTPLQYAVPCGCGDTNYIIRVLWLPGSDASNEFAVVTPDFVKIFIVSFGTDKVELVATLLAPRGGGAGANSGSLQSQNIRDCTFANFYLAGNSDAEQKRCGRYAFVMTAGGDLYYKKISGNYARHVNVYNSLLSYGTHAALVPASGSMPIAFVDDGEFQHQLDIDNERIKRDVDNTDSNCGVSVYYSHALRLTLCSYSSGKLAVLKMSNFLSSEQFKGTSANSAAEIKTTNLDDSIEEDVEKIVDNLKATIFVAPTESQCPSSFASVNKQSLSNFSELSTLPGFIFYSTTVGNIPGVLRIAPDRIAQQTLKLRSDKNPVDMALVRQNVLQDPAMPMACAMVVTEDGGFKVFITDSSAWRVWPAHALPLPKISAGIAGALSTHSMSSSSTRVGTTWKHYLTRVEALDDSTHIPVDVFEKCKSLHDVSFECRYLWEQFPREYVNKVLSPSAAPGTVENGVLNGIVVGSTTQPAARAVTINNGLTISRLPLTMVAVNADHAQYVACGLRVQLRSKTTRKCQLILKLNNVSNGPQPQQPRQISLNFAERWFDIPLTWNEAANAGNRIDFTISSPSTSSNAASQQQTQDFALLSVRLYGVPRSEFGLQDGEHASSSAAHGFAADGSGTELAVMQMLTDSSRSCLRELLNVTLLSHSLAVKQTTAADAVTNGGDERDAPFRELAKCAARIASASSAMPRDVVERANRLFLALNNNNVGEYFEKKSRVILQQAMKVLRAVDEYCVPEKMGKADSEAGRTVDDGYAILSTLLQRVLGILRPLAAKRPQSIVKSLCSFMPSFETGNLPWNNVAKLAASDVSESSQIPVDEASEAKFAVEFVRLLNTLYLQLVNVLSYTDDCASMVERAATFDVQLMTEIIVMLNVALLAANVDTKHALDFLFTLLMHKRPIVAYACKQALVDTIKPIPLGRAAAASIYAGTSHRQRAVGDVSSSNKSEAGIGNMSVTLLSEEEQRVQQSLPYNRSSLRRQGAVRQPHTSSARQRLPTPSTFSSQQPRPPPPPPPALSGAGVRELEWARLLAVAEDSAADFNASGNTSSTLSPIAALLPAAAQVARATSGLMQHLSDEQQRAMNRVMLVSNAASGGSSSSTAAAAAAAGAGAGANNAEQHNLHALIDDPALLGWAPNRPPESNENENADILIDQQERMLLRQQRNAADEALQQLVGDNASSVGIASSIQPQFGDESATSDTASAVSDGENAEDDDDVDEDDDDAHDHDDDDENDDGEDVYDEELDENEDENEDNDDEQFEDEDNVEEAEEDDENMELIDIDDDEDAAAAVVAAVLDGHHGDDLAEYENILLELSSHSRQAAGGAQQSRQQQQQQRRRLRRPTRPRRTVPTTGSSSSRAGAGGRAQSLGSVSSNAGDSQQAEPGNFVEAETASMVSSIFGSVGGAGSDSATGERSSTPVATAAQLGATDSARKPLTSDTMLPPPPPPPITVKKQSASALSDDGGSISGSTQNTKRFSSGFVRTQIIEMLLNKFPELEVCADSNQVLPALHVLTYFLYDLKMSREDERALFERALQTILRHVFPLMPGAAAAAADATTTAVSAKESNKQAHFIASQWLVRSPQHCFQVALLRVLLILTTTHYLVRTVTNNVLLVASHIGSSTQHNQVTNENSPSSTHAHASSQYMSHYTCRILCKHPLLIQVCYEALRQLLTSHYAQLSEKQKHAFLKLLPSPLIRKWPAAAVHTGSSDFAFAGNSSDANVDSLPTPSFLNRHFMPDLMPLFQRSFVRQFQYDIFALYPHMLTEMCLKLALHLARHMEVRERVAHADGAAWAHILCEYLHAGVVERKLLRKLLLLICGTRERYRQTRDLHELGRLITHVKAATGYKNFGFMPSAVPVLNRSGVVDEGGVSVAASGVTTSSLVHLSYDELAKVVESMKSCRNIALSRVASWQAFCQKERTTLTFLIRLANAVDANVCPILLSLISLALGIKSNSVADLANSAAATVASSANTGSAAAAAVADAQVKVIVLQTLQSIDQPALARFIHKFLLENDREELRWHAEYVLLGLYKYAPLNDQRLLVGLLWQEWEHLPIFGSHACQFIDLLGHLYLRSGVSSTAAVVVVGNALGGVGVHSSSVDGGLMVMKDSQCREFIAAAVRLLREQNTVLHTHANAQIYAVLHELTGTESYYLEATPCASCHSRQVPARSQKLTALKLDARYTSNTLLYKLNDCYEIEAVAVKLMDVKRVKMIKTINVYRNRRLIDSIIDMKNSPSLWHLVKTVQLVKSQTDIAIEFSLPFTATYLIFEIVDFYEDRGVASGSLQCPRCSSLVPRAQRICSNCSENVFQCLKCRSINYDEHEPFLCHSCGFSRYAKFDVNLVCKRSVVGVLAAEPIDSEEQRLRVMETLKAALERADQLQQHITLRKQQLQTLLLHLRQTELSSSLAPAQLVASLTHKSASSVAQQIAGEGVGSAAANRAKASAAATNVQPVAGRATTSAISAARRKQQQAMALTQSPPSGALSPSNLLPTPSSHVLLSQIARVYFHHCRTALDQLSVQMRRIQACKKQLQTYAARQELYYASTPSIAAAAADAAEPPTGMTDASQQREGNLPVAARANSDVNNKLASRFRCYGCAITLVRSLLRLLHAVARSRRKHLLHNVPNLIEEIINNTLHFGPSPLRLDSRNVLVAMSQDSMRVTMELSSRILAYVATVRQRCGGGRNKKRYEVRAQRTVSDQSINDAASSSAIIDGDFGSDPARTSNSDQQPPTSLLPPTTNPIVDSTVDSFAAAEQLPADMSSRVSILISLLEISCRREDRFWEIKLRCLLSLLAIACRETNALLREAVALPCMVLVNKLVKDANEQISSLSLNSVSFVGNQQHLIRSAVPSPSMMLQRALLRQLGLSSVEQASTLAYDGVLRVNLRRWMGGDQQQHSFAAWLHRMPKKIRLVTSVSASSASSAGSSRGISSTRGKVVHEARLMEKFGNRWRQRVLKRKKQKAEIKNDLLDSPQLGQLLNGAASNDTAWFRQLLFHHHSFQLRQQSARMLQQIFSISSHRKWLVCGIVMPFVPALTVDDESISSFYSFVANIVLSHPSWAVFLTSSSEMRNNSTGLPQLLAHLIGERANQLILHERCLLTPATHSTMSTNTSHTNAEPLAGITSTSSSNLLAASGFLGYGVELMSELLVSTLVPAAATAATTSSTTAAAVAAAAAATTTTNVVVESNAVVKRVREALLPQILHSYLVFKRLLLLRTQKIELAEQRLRKVLSFIGTQSGDEGAKLLIVECMNQLERLSSVGGLRQNATTAQFVYEYLCDIVFQEKQEKIACSVLIEKDPLQEDFIQGHMSSHPYPLSEFTPSSNAATTTAAAAGNSRESAAAAGGVNAASSSGGKSYEPAMRDVKNKVCRDCELIALLDDDTALELLVCGRIISLDLPVSAVYKHIWLAPPQPNGGSANKEGSPMRIMYRLRGLLGDATEEFVEKVGEEDASQEDLEAKFRLAGALSAADSAPSRLFVVLQHLREATTCFFHGVHGPFFMHVALLKALIKMLSYCVQIRSCRQTLLTHNAEWNTMSIVVHAAEALLSAGSNNANIMQQAVASGAVRAVVPQATVLQMLFIVEILIVEASSNSNYADSYNVATADDIQILWRCVRNVVAHDQHHYHHMLAHSSTNALNSAATGASSAGVAATAGVAGGANTTAIKLLHGLLRCIALLINSSRERARALAVELEPHADFVAFDAQHTFDPENNVIVEYDEHAVQLDALSTMMAVVPHQEPLIVKFKDSLLETGLIDKPLDYMQRITPTLMIKGSSTEEFQECIRQPSLRIILRMLTGFCRSHTAAQSIVGQRSVMLLHRLENVSTPLSLAAENFIEVLKENGDFTTLIENVREQSRTEKKKKAMATRAKQLQSLGMSSVGTQGKIVVASPSTALSAGIGELGEHSLLVCCVCKEGYSFYPHKVLTIYAFTRKQAVNGGEMPPSFKVTPMQGFTTVSQFNLIHSECHQSSVKGTKDQWEKAKRHNADTKCNCMLPIWAASVSETAYLNALAKYTHQITTATGLKDVDPGLHVHDLKLLLLRFAERKSFSEDSKGGGPDSNLRFLPFLLQTALCKLLSESGRLESEKLKLLTMLERSISNPKEVVEMCKGVDTPIYLLCLHLLTSGYSEWKQCRIGMLRALVIYAHVTQPSSITTGATQNTNLSSGSADFEKYKSVVRLYCLVELLYKHMFSDESLLQQAEKSTDKTAALKSSSPAESWDAKPSAHAEALQAYLRHASSAVVLAAEKVLSDFENDVLPAESIEEAFDCVGAMGNDDRFSDAATVNNIVECVVAAVDDK